VIVRSITTHFTRARACVWGRGGLLATPGSCRPTPLRPSLSCLARLAKAWMAREFGVGKITLIARIDQHVTAPFSSTSLRPARGLASSWRLASTYEPPRRCAAPPRTPRCSLCPGDIRQSSPYELRNQADVTCQAYALPVLERVFWCIRVSPRAGCRSFFIGARARRCSAVYKMES
jgi:hypothetical protein